MGRTASAYAEKGDGPSGTCDRHVMVEYCTTGGGVAGEYCRKFAAEADIDVEIDSRALLKMTPDEVQVIKDALKVGLNGAFGDDRYVYYISEGGSDLEWHGFGGNANKNVSAPYILCTAHTKETWTAYEEEQAAKETEPPETEGEGTETLPEEVPQETTGETQG